LVLVEKLGSVAAQLFTGGMETLHVQVSGPVQPSDEASLKLSAMKGFLSSLCDDTVTYVNAPRIFEKRGLNLNLATSFHESGTAQVKVVAEGSRAEERIEVSAILYDGKYARLSEINGFVFELELDADFICLQNHDRPGVIGDVGTFLAKHSVNIAQFELSRNKRGGEAMCLIKVDGGLSPTLTKGLQSLKNVISARAITGL
jgi:D-3-phosphoglycerate dehydrogenase / 2-oxoglutarate reductase